MRFWAALSWFALPGTQRRAGYTRCPELLPGSDMRAENRSPGDRNGGRGLGYPGVARGPAPSGRSWPLSVTRASLDGALARNRLRLRLNTS